MSRGHSKWRGGIRIVWLLLELAYMALGFVWLRARRRGVVTRTDRARWMQRFARRLLRVFGAELEVTGAPPTRGLVVCNHLGYMDIVTLGALLGGVFISKKEVGSWPLFGWFATRAGTLYVDRQRRSQVTETRAQMEEVLSAGLPLVLFPEGTSSDGSGVLPFRTALLEAATDERQPLHVLGVRYELASGDAGREVCWWGSMTLANHLPNLLCHRGFRARIHCRPYEGARDDRKRLAVDLREAIVGARAGAPEGASRR